MTATVTTSMMDLLREANRGFAEEAARVIVTSAGPAGRRNKRPRRLVWHHGQVRELHPTKGWRRA